MELTEQHISDLIKILSRTIPILAIAVYVWAIQNPELAARVVERFIDIPKSFLKLVGRIVDLIEKWKE